MVEREIRISFYDMASIPACNDICFLINVKSKHKGIGNFLTGETIGEAVFRAGKSPIGNPPIFLVFGYCRTEDNLGTREHSLDYALTYDEALKKAFLEASKLVGELKSKYIHADFREKLEYCPDSSIRQVLQA